ncbi:hypothetical protein VAE308_1430026 [Vibrio aestuarianus]|uniref:Secreted protein n=1 Tax=Vibrio aestuarianus TaxID=28171 RepID=A0ABM9FKZ9_9VIBR|nr:hypothetical protein VAE063_1060014 [Vibrio aestuarianus]CAH8230075.1 hypothetical protein VAE308_1430026 [Vibrio aestuarianus]
MRCVWCLRWYAGASLLRCSHLNRALAGVKTNGEFRWKGFGFSSYTPDKSQFLNYLASGTFWEVFELNEVCLREMLCLLSSLAWLLCC